MQDKLFFIIFLFISVFIYPQSTADDFINNTYWYQNYLPVKNFSEYQTLRNALMYLKENDPENFMKLNEDLSELIQYFNIIVNENLQKEKIKASQKIGELNEFYNDDNAVKILLGKYSAFEKDVDSNKFPQNDFCLAEINALYSELITRLGYKTRTGVQVQNKLPLINKSEYQEYTVLNGDSLWRIALKTLNNRHLWRQIYELNKENKDFLPVPGNWHLIYPNVIIKIPPKQE